MTFNVQKEVLEAGVKILFVVIEELDNATENEAWEARRTEWLESLYRRYKDADVHEDPLLEGFNLLHDRTGVKRRKNIPASENLIKLLVKHGTLARINKVVDIYNAVSLDSRLALGAHNMEKTDGDVTLRFSTGTERFVPLGQAEPQPVKPHEYCYVDDSNEVLCRLEIRQSQKTLVDETAKNVFYIVQGNAATPQEMLEETARRLIELTTRYAGGTGRVVVPEEI